MKQPAPPPGRRPTSVESVVTFPRFADPANPESAIENRDLRLVFDFSAIATLEDLYDLPLREIGAKFQDTDALRVRDLQRMIYAGTRRHHADLTEQGVMDVLNDAVATGVPLGDMMQSAFGAFDASAGPDQLPKGDDLGEGTGATGSP